jgi:hypothetical protein
MGQYVWVIQTNTDLRRETGHDRYKKPLVPDTKPLAAMRRNDHPLIVMEETLPIPSQYLVCACQNVAVAFGGKSQIRVRVRAGSGSGSIADSDAGSGPGSGSDQIWTPRLTQTIWPSLHIARQEPQPQSGIGSMMNELFRLVCACDSSGEQQGLHLGSFVGTLLKFRISQATMLCARPCFRSR